MYKVLKVGEKAWQVFYLASPDTDPVPVARPVLAPSDEEGKYKPYTQRQAAYRRCKKLNDALEKVNALIAKDGAIIL